MYYHTQGISWEYDLKRELRYGAGLSEADVKKTYDAILDWLIREQREILRDDEIEPEPPHGIETCEEICHENGWQEHHDEDGSDCMDLLKFKGWHHAGKDCEEHCTQGHISSLDQ
jgi:hypothetical protein